jgi:Mg-chelatase subunit ChlD
LKKLSAADILANLNPLEKAQLEPGKSGESSQDKLPSVVSENDSNREALKRLEDMKFLKKDQEGKYSLTRKALEYLMDELKQKLQSGEISQDEYNQQKSRLMEQNRNISKPQYRMPTKELANTIMEMMDAQDKLWDREVNFSTMHVYYHIKENSEGVNISTPKRDYNALKRLIDDLEKQKILLASEQSSGFILSGLALNVLLKYLMDHSDASQGIQGLTGTGNAWTNERLHEIRRFSSGDPFRDISVRHTLKEIARQKKGLCDVRNSDFRVFLKQPRKPQYDIIICLDTSGSMGFHQKLTYSRLVAAGLVQAALRDGNRVGIVAFSDHGQVTVPLTDKDKDSLLDCIAAVTPRGNTNIGDGIKSSRELLFQTYNSNQKYIMLITDGQPTAISEKAFAHLKEMKEKDLTEESALLETRQAAARGIRVSVIHIAGQDEASGTFIKNIAQVGKGKIRRISNSDDIKTVLR